MAEWIAGLTEQDIKVLKGLIASVRSRPLNTAGRTFVDDPPDTAASSYIIKTPSAGIPARAGAGVSAATCRVYQRVDSDLVDAGFDRTVYNATGAAIDGNIYTTATRDPWGTLWADDVVGTGTTSGGGSGITSINDDTTPSQTIGLGTVGTDINITTTAAAYNAGVIYSRGMLASSGGSTYRYSNATPSAGNAPPNVTYWVDVTGDGLTIINVPDASATSDGIVNQATQQFKGDKEFVNAVYTQDSFYARDGASYTTQLQAYAATAHGVVVFANASLVQTGFRFVSANDATDDAGAVLFGTHGTHQPKYQITGAGFGSTLKGVYGTTGGGDTVSGGIITAVGSPSAGSLTGIVAKANGGTGEDNSTGGTANTFWARPDGATGAASYRTIAIDDLPIVIGTDVQAWSASLDSLVTAMPAADIGALTDSTGGTANTTLVAVAGTGDDANINDNFADLAAQVNAVRAALQTLGLMA